MSLSRLMLRSLACVALQKQADDPFAPTMAGENVFDSRMDPLEFKFDKINEGDTPEIPAIAVYTDDDESTIINRGSGDGPFRRAIDLRVEIAIGSFAQETKDDKTSLVFQLPTTDAELEAQLDLFETQVRWALLSIPNRVYTNAFRSFVVRIESIVSHVARDASGNNRFAQRWVHFRCVVNDDCPPSAGILAPNQPIPKALDIDPSTFPSPWLAPMLEVLKKSPNVKPVIDVLTNSGNPYTFVPLLKRIGFNVDAIEPEADPNLLAAQGKTQGPDGRIEVKTLLEIK